MRDVIRVAQGDRHAGQPQARRGSRGRRRRLLASHGARRGRHARAAAQAARRADRSEDRRARRAHRVHVRRRHAAGVSERDLRAALRGRGAARVGCSATCTSRPTRRSSSASGINLGDIIVEGDDIMGDGVNVAARLETTGRSAAGSAWPLRCGSRSHEDPRCRVRRLRRAARQEHLEAHPRLPGRARARRPT